MHMTKKWMAVLALGLVAPAAFGQTATAVPAKKAKAVPAAAGPAAGQMKVLRDEIQRDKQDLTAKRKTKHAARVQREAQRKAEFAKVKASSGTRAEKALARRALRVKYAQLMKEARQKDAYERRNLREDMTSKSGLIKKLRQS
jgi:ribosome-binding protein aMBF1 (putative translation factor)